ncbi:carbohydrate kinase family protein [uncultured Treponema sp.]|uniref:carbohydrate kinase family protein n=1 Tax=uncultured Treponema sp. TaxID=162155 RepID=UPI0025EEF93B|nr:carbohydrate kinase family protein [uncultured Treponema sp.]
MKILVSGLVNVETSAKVRGFPINYYPIDYPFFGLAMNVGGVGFNVSRALKTLGDEVNFVSFTGDDLPAQIIEETFKKDAIETKSIQKDLKQTPQSVVLYDDSGKRQIYCDLKDIQDMRLDCERLKNEINTADAVVCCNINFNRTLLHEAKKAGKLIATDVHVLSNINDEYNREFLENADIVFLSDESLPCEPNEFLSSLKARYNMKIIVLGQGSKGATLYERQTDKIAHFECVPCKNVVNTVGAGDALFSSFVHFYVKGFSAEKALRYAQTFASCKIEHNGASVGFLSEEELKKQISE